jgi:AAA+ superfamily predicted ATPase
MPRGELEKTGEWIRNAPTESVMDGARAAYASRIAREKPNEALEQALLMTDALGRERVAVPIVQRMFKQDPEAFKEWLPKSGLSLPAQQRIIRGK